MGQQLVVLLWDSRHGFLLEQGFPSDCNSKHAFHVRTSKVIELWHLCVEPLGKFRETAGRHLGPEAYLCFNTHEGQSCK